MKYDPRLLGLVHENRVLAIMLLVLHIAVHADPAGALSAALMTAHLGLFFLWQPIWRPDRRLDVRSAVMVIAFTVAFVAALGWWTVFAWLIVLIGIVAGRSFSTREERYTYMLALAFLVSELLVECAPNVFEIEPPMALITESFKFGLTALPVVIFWLPQAARSQKQTFPVDFFRGITFALMTGLLSVSSVLITHDTAVDYPFALVVSLIVLAAFLLLISWLIAPGTGGGLGSLWEQSLLNIGTPFEAWLGGLAEQAERQESPRAFLEAAAVDLVDLPWVAGVAWKTARFNGVDGDTRGHPTVLETPDLIVTLYTTRRASPALLLHCRLLVQVLGHFYSAKSREFDHAKAAHMRAIHETGARLTHDIKNLLQSLHTLTQALDQSRAAGDEIRVRAGQQLLERQLPHIAQRLQLAIDKLQQPGRGGGEACEIDAWWRRLRTRCDGHDIDFAAAIDDPGTTIPGECFDCVVENLIDNARHKTRVESGVRIRVTATVSDGRVVVTVGDNGSAIDAALAARLFEQPVASQSGLGVGLYQAAHQAAHAGYGLRLAANRDGEVRFELAAGGGDSERAGILTADAPP